MRPFLELKKRAADSTFCVAVAISDWERRLRAMFWTSAFGQLFRSENPAANSVQTVSAFVPGGPM